MVLRRLHVLWLNTTSGKLRTGHRYSVKLTYNTFPIPELSADNKEILTQTAIEILGVREQHPELTLAEMYDPDKMPSDLLDAHLKNDQVIDKLYGITKEKSEEQKLDALLRTYKKREGSQNA